VHSTFTARRAGSGITWRAPFASLLWAIVVVAGAGACRTPEQTLTDQNKTLESLRATATAVADAWLAGDVSSTFARTALEETLQLLENSRSELAASPALLADPQFANLTQSLDRLTRTVGALWKNVGDGDAAAVRRQLAEVRPPHDDRP
jgi:hypothetical protein